MTTNLRLTVAWTTMATVCSGVIAQPVITGLDEDMPSRSGMVAILGDGFGQGPGSVEIGGLPALVSSWTEQRVVAYVPEAAALGEATLRLVTPFGEPVGTSLTVVDRQRQGRLLWMMRTDGRQPYYRPAQASDGTLYSHITGGLVYAVAPNGALKWIEHVDAWPYAPPATDDQGNVYLSTLDKIISLNTQGERNWELIDFAAQAVQVGATQGPDGQMYAAYDGGMGAVSMSTDGILDWFNPGNPPMFENGGTGAEVVFGPSTQGGPIDQMYIAMNRFSDAHIWAFSLDGQQKLAIPTGTNQADSQVAVAANGDLVISHFIAAGFGWVIEAFDPQSGQSKWRYDGDFISSLSAPVPGPDGTIYYQADSSKLEALDPVAQETIWAIRTGNPFGRPALSPDGTMLVLGGSYGLGEQSFVRAYDAANGRELWNVDLPIVEVRGVRWSPKHYPRFSADGRTVYVNASQLAGDSESAHSLLIAIDVFGCRVDLDGSGDVDLFDFLAFQNLFDAGDLAADFDGDGDLTIFDFLAFQNEFDIGCV